MRKPRNSKTPGNPHKFPVSPELGDFYGWLKEAFAFKLSSTTQQIFTRSVQGAYQRLPEIHHSIQMGSVHDWISIARAWELLYAVKTLGRVLDIGCGDGWPSIPLAIRGRTVVGIDVAKCRVEAAGDFAEALEAKNAQFLEMSAEFLDFHEATFDSVIFSQSLEHCLDPQQALREVHRVLKPGGRLIIACQSLKPFERLGEALDIWGFWLNPDHYQVNITVRFFESMKEETCSLVLPKDLGTEENPHFLLQEALQKKKGDVKSLRQFLTKWQGKEKEALISSVQHLSPRKTIDCVKELGFRELKMVHDAGPMTQHFLMNHHLQAKSHPFFHFPTFEGICAGLGALALETEANPEVDDGIIIAEKSF